MNYIDSLEKSADDIPSTIFDDARNHWKTRFKEIKKMNGRENPYQSVSYTHLTLPTNREV